MPPIGPLIELAVLFATTLVLAFVLNLCITLFRPRAARPKRGRLLRSVRLVSAHILSPCLAAFGSVLLAESIIDVAPYFGVDYPPMAPLAAAWGGGPPTWLRGLAYTLGGVISVVASTALFLCIAGYIPTRSRTGE